MTLNSDDRNNLILFRLQQAEETIKDVQILLDNDRYRAAINRIYYGIFYSLSALALKHQFETSKHPKLIGRFNKNFIHKGIIEVKYGKIVNQAYNLRSKGDYDLYVDFNKETVTEMLEDLKK